MNEDKDRFADTVSDPAVREAYKACATEEPPAHVDRAILKEADRARRGQNVTPWLYGWVGPAAFVAMAVLSLTVVLEFDRAETMLFPVDQPGNYLDTPPESSQDRANELTSAVESTGRMLRELDKTAESIIPLEKSNAGRRVITGTEAAAVAVKPAADRFCDASQTESAASWWSCIERLRQEGLVDAARSESELLHLAFPKFQSDK